MIDLEKMKARLEAEKAKLEAELAHHGKKDTHTGDWEGSSDMTVDEADESEVADKLEETATNVAIVEELEARYKDVMHALSKFDRGTYGICEENGMQISAERLEANPAARTGSTHA